MFNECSAGERETHLCFLASVELRNPSLRVRRASLSRTRELFWSRARFGSVLSLSCLLSKCRFLLKKSGTKSHHSFRSNNAASPHALSARLTSTPRETRAEFTGYVRVCARPCLCVCVCVSEGGVVLMRAQLKQSQYVNY